MGFITIVIPTYNRGHQLKDVISCILSSETDGLHTVEILVVDDSSKTPAEKFIDRELVKPPFTIEFIVQSNAGPAAARTSGMKKGKGEIVLFIDDDVLVTKTTLLEHYQTHKLKPGSIIYGNYPYSIPKKKTLAYLYLKGLLDAGLEQIRSANPNEKIVKVESVASGNLSVPKGLFNETNPLYDTSLTIPAAEEYDLMYTLKKRGIPVYLGIDYMNAWHLQPPTIRDKCFQEYKYGQGIAEVCIKKPEVLEKGIVRNIFLINGPILPTDRFKTRIKKNIKQLLVGEFFRNSIHIGISFFEKIAPVKFILFPLYRLISGLSMAAGVKQGIKIFGRQHHQS